MADEKLCPQCGRTYGADDRFCTVDGATLVNAGNSGSLIGTVLAERYLVSERLGEGGMGEVYLAEHVRMKRKVAVKIMRKWMVGDPVAVSRFHREAENASQITHPNVAQVYDFGETSDGTIYLAMEFVPGEPLSKILDREGRLNAVRTQEVVRQTADALVAAHGMGILHRDLKPDNVMVARTRAGTDVVKLVDFGIARVMSRGTQQFTSTGMIVGTPEYMSPEQLANDNLDERSDLYALGLIAFRTLTGHGAFPEGATGEALIARLTNRARKLADVRPDVAWPESLQAAFDKVLAADPAERFVDALEFAAVFDGAIGELPLTEEEQVYLAAISQRVPTPSRLGTIDAYTPARAMGAITNTPPMGQQSIALRTPPSEQRPAFPSRQTGEFADPPAPPTTPAAATGVPSGGDELPPTVERAPVAASGVTVPPSPPVAYAAIPTPASTPAVHSTTPSDATSEAPSENASPTLTVDGDEPSAPAGGNSGRAIAVVGGVLALAAVAFAAMKLAGGKDDVSAPPAAAVAAPVAPPAPSLQPTAATVTDSAPVSTATSAAADSQRVNRARSGVVVVVGSGDATATAAIIDAAKGLLLTSSSIVPSDKNVRVFLDGSDRYVRASVLGVDNVTGVATLLASLKECRRCKALELDAGTTTPPLAAGDSLAAIAATRKGVQAPTWRAVSAVDEKGIATTSTLAASVVGAPLILPRTGSIVGLAARRGSSVAIVPAAALVKALEGARAAAQGMTPNDTVAWDMPSRAVPQEVLDEAVKLPETALDRYKTTVGGYTVFAVTPQVLAWRWNKSGAAAADSRNPFDIPGGSTPRGPADPAAAWDTWGQYHALRRAVVILEIAPAKASYPTVPDKPLEAKDADFYSMELTRDGAPLKSLASRLVFADTKQDEYKKKKKKVPNAGLYAFHPGEFTPTSASFVVNIADPTGKRTSIPLPQAMLEAIAKDLGEWQRR